MYKSLIYLVLLLPIFSCTEKQHADLIVKNAKIYTVDENFSTAEAFAVTNGRFVFVGSTKEIKSKFKAAKVYDAKGKIIYPGLIDAHCHFYGLGIYMQKVDLAGTKSFDEVLERIQT